MNMHFPYGHPVAEHSIFALEFYYFNTSNIFLRILNYYSPPMLNIQCDEFTLCALYYLHPHHKKQLKGRTSYLWFLHRSLVCRNFFLSTVSIKHLTETSSSASRLHCIHLCVLYFRSLFVSIQ
jgi:hypothetical protein